MSEKKIRACTVTLDRVDTVGQSLVAVLRGPNDWQVNIHVHGRDLQTFDRLQALVADVKSLWIGHESQSFATAASRRKAWHDAVSVAFCRGETF